MTLRSIYLFIDVTNFGNLNLEDRVKQLEDRVTKLEGLVSGKKAASSQSSKSDDIEALVVGKINDIGTQDLVAVALKLKAKQTKAEIKSMLKDLGKGVGNWFEGSNFNRLLRKGTIKEDGNNEKNVTLYSLSKKGEKDLQELVDKIKSGDYH